MIFFPHSPSSSTLKSNDDCQLGWSYNKGQDLSMKTATPWPLKVFDGTKNQKDAPSKTSFMASFILLCILLTIFLTFNIYSSLLFL
jgi:hypothetical protein